MAQKRFQNSMFGFNKTSVNTYIESLTRDYEEKLTAKDVEIEKMIAQLKSVNKKYESIRLDEERILTEKEKISLALVSANEKAQKIVDEAKSTISAEVAELEATAEKERERLVDIRTELKAMKADAKAILEKYEKAINDIIIEEPEETAKPEKVDEKPAPEPVEEAKPSKEIEITEVKPVVTQKITWTNPDAEEDDDDSDDFFG